MNELDEKIRNEFRNDLLRDINIIENTMLNREDMVAASSDLRNRQQFKINELSKQIEGTNIIIMNVYKQNIDRFKSRYQHKSEDEVLSANHSKSPAKRDSNIPFRATGVRSMDVSPIRTTTMKSLKKSSGSTASVTDLQRESVSPIRQEEVPASETPVKKIDLKKVMSRSRIYF